MAAARSGGHMDRGAAADSPSVANRGAVSAERTADRRVLAILCLSMFLAVVNFAAPSPFFPAMARDLGTTVPLLGQLTTILALLSAGLGLLVGPLADRYGVRRAIVGGTIAVAINLAGTGLAPSYPALVGLAAVSGLGDAVLFGLPLAVATTRFAGDARRRAVAWTSAALPVGTIAGVPLVAAAGGVVGWRTVLVGVGLATLGAAALAAAWLPADAPKEGRIRAREVVSAYAPLLRHRPLIAVYAASGLRAACWIGLFTYLGAFLADDVGFAPEGVGVTYMVVGAGVIAGSFAAGRLGRVPPRPLVASTTALQGVLLSGAVVLPLAPVLTVTLLTVAAFVGAIAFVGLTTLLIGETPGGPATTMVLNGSIFNLGSAAGGALGGLLIAAGGYVALGLGLPAFALVAAVAVWAPAHRST